MGLLCTRELDIISIQTSGGPIREGELESAEAQVPERLSLRRKGLTSTPPKMRHSTRTPAGGEKVLASAGAPGNDLPRPCRASPCVTPRSRSSTPPQTHTHTHTGLAPSFCCVKRRGSQKKTTKLFSDLEAARKIDCFQLLRCIMHFDGV